MTPTHTIGPKSLSIAIGLVFNVPLTRIRTGLGTATIQNNCERNAADKGGRTAGQSSRGFQSLTERSAKRMVIVL